MSAGQPWRVDCLKKAIAAGGGKMGAEVYFGPQKSEQDYIRLAYQMRVACRKLGIPYITDRAKQREYKEVQSVKKIFPTTQRRFRIV